MRINPCGINAWLVSLYDTLSCVQSWVLNPWTDRQIFQLYAEQNKTIFNSSLNRQVKRISIPLETDAQ